MANQQYLLNQNLVLPEVLEVWKGLQSSALLTFVPGTEREHLPTALVRNFKDSRDGRSPAVYRAIAAAFAAQSQRIVREYGITHICRVLGSWETRADAHAPLEVFTRALSEACSLPVVYPMRRTTPRPPMSTTRNLTGQDAVIRRIRYASQDMIFSEDGALSGAKVLIVDDIRCIGASEAVWAWALIKLGGATVAAGLNLAQMEHTDYRSRVFDIDCEIIREQAIELCDRSERRALDPIWLDPHNNTLHRLESCPILSQARVRLWRILTPAGSRICGRCEEGLHKKGGVLARFLAGKIRRAVPF